MFSYQSVAVAAIAHHRSAQILTTHADDYTMNVTGYLKLRSSAIANQSSIGRRGVPEPGC